MVAGRLSPVAMSHCACANVLPASVYGSGCYVSVRRARDSGSPADGRAEGLTALCSAGDML